MLRLRLSPLSCCHWISLRVCELDELQSSHGADASRNTSRSARPPRWGSCHTGRTGPLHAAWCEAWTFPRGTRPGSSRCTQGNEYSRVGSLQLRHRPSDLAAFIERSGLCHDDTNNVPQTITQGPQKNERGRLGSDAQPPRSSFRRTEVTPPQGVIGICGLSPLAAMRTRFARLPLPLDREPAGHLAPKNVNGS